MQKDTTVMQLTISWVYDGCHMCSFNRLRADVPGLFGSAVTPLMALGNAAGVQQEISSRISLQLCLCAWLRQPNELRCIATPKGQGPCMQGCAGAWMAASVLRVLRERHPQPSTLSRPACQERCVEVWTVGVALTPAPPLQGGWVAMCIFDSFSHPGATSGAEVSHGTRRADGSEEREGGGREGTHGCLLQVGGA